MSEFQLILNDLNYYYLISEPAIYQYIVLLLSAGLFYFSRKRIHEFILQSRSKRIKAAINGIERVFNPLLILILLPSSARLYLLSIQLISLT